MIEEFSEASERQFVELRRAFRLAEQLFRPVNLVEILTQVVRDTAGNHGGFSSLLNK
jgi:hypothetical protein